MQLNVPNQDHSAVAANEPCESVTKQFNYNDKNVVNVISNRNVTSSSTARAEASSLVPMLENSVIGVIVDQLCLTIRVNKDDHNQSPEQIQV